MRDAAKFSVFLLMIIVYFYSANPNILCNQRWILKLRMAWFPCIKAAGEDSPTGADGSDGTG